MPKMSPSILHLMMFTWSGLSRRSTTYYTSKGDARSTGRGKMREIPLTAPVSMSYIRAPRLHQSTARLCPFLVRISGALIHGEKNIRSHFLPWLYLNMGYVIKCWRPYSTLTCTIPSNLYYITRALNRYVFCLGFAINMTNVHSKYLPKEQSFLSAKQEMSYILNPCRRFERSSINRRFLQAPPLVSHALQIQRNGGSA